MDANLHIRSFSAFCRGKGLSRHTTRAYQGDLKDFKQWLSSKPVQFFDRTILEAWLGEMRKREYAPTTIKRKFATLRVAFNWLQVMKLIDTNPFQDFNPTIKLPHKLPRALSKTDLVSLFRQAKQEAQGQASLSKKTMKLALELLFATGVRVGELCGIKLKDIDGGDGVIRVNGKGKRERQVYVVDHNVLYLLHIYISEHSSYSVATDTLLLTNRGSAATPDFVRRNLHGISRRAKIKRRITPHMLRHSAATQLIEQGVDIRYVQRLLGHSSISTTEIYTHVSDTSLKACLINANPRALLNP